jgi:glycosyltransferase involved in cell wall biosynthesis
MSQSYLTVLIPAYNEQEGIAATITRLCEQLDRLAFDYEILVVDDGSRDQTAQVVRGLASADPRVRLAQHSRNLGIGAGIQTGIEKARGEFMIFVPADLAMNPEQIGRYVEVSRRADIVLGNRSDRRDYTLARKIVSACNIFLLRFLFGLKQHQFAYINLYRTSILRRMRIETRGVFISHELVIKARDLGARIAEVKIDYVPRQTGQATGARLSTVVQATWETWAFWVKWVYRTVTRRRSHGYWPSATT